MKNISEKPIIAIVGRTNVGKSTLFNTLAEENKALVSAIPGTTRDRAFADCVWRGQIIQIIDTGGFEKKNKSIIDTGIKTQIQLALEQADLIFFVANIRDGVLPEDTEFARALQKINKPVIFIANKADKKELTLRAKDPEWQKLGFGDPLPISATTGLGVGDLLDDAYKKLNEINKKPQPIVEIEALKIGIFGKPNAGKSSLINALLNEERMIVSDLAFTTREPQDTFVSYQGKDFVLIDTAGIRKQAKIKKGLEAKGVQKTKNILESIDVALLVIDISESIGAQDKNLANLIHESGKGLIIIANKWDLIKNKDTRRAKEFTDYINSQLPFVKWAPIIFTSAKNRKNVMKIFEIAEEVQKEMQREITANALDKFLKKAIKKARPTGGAGMVTPPHIYSMKQTEIMPPTFEVLVKTKHVIHPNYLKYLEKQLREKFGFSGAPIIIKSRSRK